MSTGSFLQPEDISSAFTPELVLAPGAAVHLLCLSERISKCVCIVQDVGVPVH